MFWLVTVFGNGGNVENVDACNGGKAENVDAAKGGNVVNVDAAKIKLCFLRFVFCFAKLAFQGPN